MSSQERTPGIGALRQAPPPEQLELLREEIKVFDERKRLDAVRKLGALHDTRAVPDLVGRLHIDGSPEAPKPPLKSICHQRCTGLARHRDCPETRRQPRCSQQSRQALGLSSGRRDHGRGACGCLKRCRGSGVRKQAAIGIGKLQNTSVTPRLIAGLAQVNGARELFETDHVEALVQLGGWTVVEGIVASSQILGKTPQVDGRNTDTGTYLLHASHLLDMHRMLWQVFTTAASPF